MNTDRNDHQKDHLSVSQLNLYLLCPLKYRYTYIDKLPKPFKSADLVLGTAFHAAVAWWHSHKSKATFDKVRSIFQADLKAQENGPIRFKKDEILKSLESLGTKMLEVFIKTYRGSPVLESEQHFRVPIIDVGTGEELDIPLEGYFDLVEIDNTIVELKTSARVYDQSKILQHLQLTGYAYAHRILYDQLPHLRLVVVTKSKQPKMQVVEVDRDRNDLIRFFHLTKSIYRSIQNRQFYPNHGWHCAACEYASICQKWRG